MSKESQSLNALIDGIAEIVEAIKNLTKKPSHSELESIIDRHIYPTYSHMFDLNSLYKLKFGTILRNIEEQRVGQEDYDWCDEKRQEIRNKNIDIKKIRNDMYDSEAYNEVVKSYRIGYEADVFIEAILEYLLMLNELFSIESGASFVKLLKIFSVYFSNRWKQISYLYKHIRELVEKDKFHNFK